jgi:hypothetical protein
VDAEYDTGFPRCEPMPHIYARAVRRASEIVGPEALATLLKVTLLDIDRWARGELKSPQGVFLRCVDIIVEYDTKPESPGRTQ